MATGALHARPAYWARSPKRSEPFVHSPAIPCRWRRRLLGVIAVASACASPVPERAVGDAAARPPVIDDFGDTLRLARAAARIVSLNPVTTEALFAIGAGQRLVGRTHWDAAPAEARRVQDVGDGIQPNVEAVLAVRPDLVVLYAAEVNRAAAAAFRRAGVPTLTMRTDRVADFSRALRALGRVIGDSTGAARVADSVRRSIDAVRAMPAHVRPVTVFWHAWEAPVITIGAGSFLSELVEAAGVRNVFGDLPDPSPQVTLESVAQRNPDYVLAGPQVARRMRADPRWRTVAAVRDGRILVVDTTLMGRPGVRMGEAARSLRALIDSALGARP